MTTMEITKRESMDATLVSQGSAKNSNSKAIQLSQLPDDVAAVLASLDTNGDGNISLAEFQENLLPKTRKKIEMKLEAGWTFDKEKWEASLARHKSEGVIGVSE